MSRIPQRVLKRKKEEMIFHEFSLEFKATHAKRERGIDLRVRRRNAEYGEQTDVGGGREKKTGYMLRARLVLPSRPPHRRRLHYTTTQWSSAR